MATQERPRIEYRTPQDLVSDVLSGAIRIPWFQRGFQWEASDVVKLFDSVVRGFPIGDLLLWQRPAPAQRLTVGPVEVDAPQLDAALWVVDGQQRIASLVGALVGARSASDSRFRVHLDLDTGDFHTVGPRDEPPGHWVPVDVLAEESALRTWIGASPWLDHAQTARADRTAEAFHDYRIPVYLIESVDEGAVREMFERINTGGRRLEQPEVFGALRDSGGQHQVSTVTHLASVTAAMNFGALSEDIAAACVHAYWDGDGPLDPVATALRLTTDFLRGEAGIPHARLVPEPDALPVLVRFVRYHGAPVGRSAVLLRRWLWRSAAASAMGDRRYPADPYTVRPQGDAVDAASAIVCTVPPVLEFRPDLVWSPPGWGPMTALVVLGLAAEHPRDLTTGDPVDVQMLMHRPRIVAPVLDDGPATFANLLLHPPTAAETADALRAAAEVVLGSHLVDGEARRRLAAGDEPGFFARRAEAVTDAVRWHMSVMAEWGARDGRAVADIIRSVA